MAVITPNTNIRLMKLPLELSNTNQLTFSSEQNQEYYFKHLEHYLEIEDATYQRKDGTLRFPANYDEVLQYNYCMYQNESYSSKWFYAFIDDIQWLSNDSVAITLKTDVFQTWQFDLEYKQSFVEREHVTDDTVGLHTVPEDLETGDYISTKLQPTGKNFGDTCFCVTTTEQVFTGYSTLNETLPTGVYYTGLTTLQGVKNLLDQIENDEIVNGVFVVPKDFFGSWSTVSGVDGQVSTSVRFSLNLTMIEVTHVDYLGNDYLPKNNKLKCYPYSYLQVSNHSGTVVNYKWEDFNLLEAGDRTKIQFTLGCALSPGCSGYCYPINYKNIFNNYDDGITYGKFPIGGWNSDTYTNWLTQNGVNNAIGIGLGATAAVIGVAGAAFTGGASLAIAGAVVGGLSTIASSVGSRYQHSLAPDQAMGNTNAGDFNFAYGWLELEFKRMSIKNEYAKIIDNFFSMFGYKVNVTKVPNINTRSNWNYVKTIGANLHGYIPTEDLNELKGMFDNGITLWHHPTTFLDYTQNNTNV